MMTQTRTPEPSTSSVAKPSTQAPKATAQRVQNQQPNVDIYENEREFFLIADVPGATKDSLTVQFDRGQLSFEATAVEAKQADGRVTKYLRAFSVPDTVDSTKIEAELEAGVLRMHLPKVESAKPVQIPVRGA